MAALLQSKAKPIVVDAGKEAAASPPCGGASQFNRGVKKLERPGGGTPTWPWGWRTLRQERWGRLGWVSLSTRR